MSGVATRIEGRPTSSLVHLASRLGTSEQSDLHLSDQAYWPVVRETWSQENRVGETRQLKARDVVSSPAGQSPYAGLVRNNCGTPLLRGSWSLAICPPVVTGPCSANEAVALEEHLLFLQRRGKWLVWFSQP